MANINEATFEAKLNAAIGKAFPTITPIRIAHQQTFSLKFGHHGVTVDGEEQYRAGGRTDILLKIDGVPRVMFELKRPGEALTDDDRDQGISYSRLLEPMPPFTVVSNGEDVRIFQTYDRKEFSAKTASEQDFENLVNFGLVHAAQERSEAIRVLIGRQPEVWAAVIKTETTIALEKQNGAIGNFAQVLCREFSVKRTATTQVRQLLDEEHRIVVVDGDAQSGKTNALANLCGWPNGTNSSPPFEFLYVDAFSSKQGIFQLLAHHFTRGLGIPVSAEDLRRWIGGGAATDEKHRLVMVLDGWNSETGGMVATDLDELLLMATQGSLRIILGLDTAVYESVRNVPGRPTTTAIGRAPRVNVHHLNYEEFSELRQYLINVHGTDMVSGAQHAKPFRRPRVIRSYLSIPADPYPSVQGESQPLKMISGVVGPELLHLMDRFLAPFAELDDDLQVFSQAISSEAEAIKNGLLKIATYQTGCVSIRTAEKVLGPERLARLRGQGYCRVKPGPEWTALAEITTPECFASAASHRIAKELIALRQEERDEEAYSLLIKETISLPYGDIVAAVAILAASARDQNDITDLISRLMADSPKINNIKAGSVLSIYDSQKGEIAIRLGEGMDSEILIGNIFPWLVLSQLLMLPLGDESSSREGHVQLLAQVGAFPHILRSPGDFHLQELMGIHVHEISNEGCILCGSSGIIEPITQAIQNAFLEMPTEAVKLAELARDHKSVFLAFRLNAVCDSLNGVVDLEIDAAAKRAKDIVLPVISTFLDEFVQRHKANLEDSQKGETRLDLTDN